MKKRVIICTDVNGKIYVFTDTKKARGLVMHFEAFFETIRLYETYDNLVLKPVENLKTGTK